MRDQIIPVTLSGCSLEYMKVEMPFLLHLMFFLHLVLSVIVLVILDRPIAGVHTLNEFGIHNQPLLLLFLRLNLLLNIFVLLLGPFPFVHVQHGVAGVDGLLGLPSQDLVGDALRVIRHAVFDLACLGGKVR